MQIPGELWYIFSLEKKRLNRDMKALLKYLKGQLKASSLESKIRSDVLKLQES